MSVSDEWVQKWADEIGGIPGDIARDLLSARARIAELEAKVARLRKFVADCRDNWDCDDTCRDNWDCDDTCGSGVLTCRPCDAYSLLSALDAEAAEKARARRKGEG